ncbi:MAG TPA: ectonucleotide pyrophosphatase/phosphodiesterase [Rubricoccaceae bacterium]|nr:ectonucleotide pyrophosphatase/phosphodiesterase [Rubricoccaceae bacterium]
MSRRTLVALAVLGALLLGVCAAVLLAARLLLGVLDRDRSAASDAPAPTLLLISIDGFRHDYLGHYPAPTLERIAREGVRAARLVPSYPSVTFPNHYTLVTGLRPEHHGIVGNRFYDPDLDATFDGGDLAARAEARWWGGEPIWVTAERQGRRAMVLSWPGAEAAVGGVRPSQWSPFDGGLPYAARVDTVLAWLDLPPDQRPAFLTLYFEGVDGAGHSYGPNAPETAAAVAEVDRALARLLDGLDARGLTDRIHLVVVSDHGMAEMRADRVVVLDDHLGPHALADVARMLDGEPMGLWPEPGRADGLYRALRAARLPHVRVVRREETPAHLHYRASPRIPPILLMADEGWTVTTRARWAQRDGPAAPAWGTHGFDPRLPSMGALLLARGPAFRQGVTVGPVENVHVYALMAHVLGLRAAPNDGDLRSVRAFLR